MNPTGVGSSSLVSNPLRVRRVVTRPVQGLFTLLVLFFVGCRGADWTFRLKDIGISYGGATASTTVEVLRTTGMTNIPFSKTVSSTNVVGPGWSNP